MKPVLKPVFDFLEQETERDDEFYYRLYLILMEEISKA
jgi:hypothetical protein